MAVVETSGIIKHKDSNGNMVFFYPTTLKDNVSGMEEIDNHLTSEDNPHKVTAEQVGALSSKPAYMASTDGVTYTCTVPGISALTVGASFIGIPKLESTSQAVKLNVNNLGAKLLRRRVSVGSATTASGYNNSWIAANKPITVVYDGTFWVVDIVQPHASDLMGSVPIDKGGTGATTAAQACENLGALAKTGGTLTGNLSGQYITGTWLQSTEAANLGKTPGKIAVLDDSGWVCYRTPAEIKTDISVDTKTIIDTIYPVGSIYITLNQTSPSKLFPGTYWKQIKNRFLLSASSTYSALSIGGEATHTLTENEIPAHQHSIWCPNEGGEQSAAIGYPEAGSKNTWYAEASKTSSAGGGQAHNNMPPYLAVYMWERVYQTQASGSYNEDVYFLYGDK